MTFFARGTSYGRACAADVWLFSSVQMEEISNDSCVQLIAFRWLDPLATCKCQLQTHLTNLQAKFGCDGTCRRLIGVVDRHMRATDPFCCIRVHSLWLCLLRRHDVTSRSTPDLCPRTHVVGRRLHLEKTGTFSRVCYVYHPSIFFNSKPKFQAQAWSSKCPPVGVARSQQTSNVEPRLARSDVSCLNTMLGNAGRAPRCPQQDVAPLSGTLRSSSVFTGTCDSLCGHCLSK